MRITLLALWLCPSLALAEVTLAPLFRDHAILQRDRPLPIWGRAEPGETVTVTLRQQSARATTAPDGRWQLILAPESFSPTPAELSASAPSGTALSTDIWLGDVWLCSGQSNMEWSVANSLNPETEIAAANFPLIRQLDVPNLASPEPNHGFDASWQLCTPSTAGNFTAIGYYFARELHTRTQVPIGLLNATWGGTPIEVWMSPAAIASDPAFAIINDRWEKTLADYPAKLATHHLALKSWEDDLTAARALDPAAKPKSPKPRAPRDPYKPWSQQPSSLYLSMIEPLTPTSLRGILWYQGESNDSRANEYAALFRSLITSWRRHFGQPELPFYFVQLASFNPAPGLAAGWPALRAAQAEALSLPHTGMAVAIDIGDPKDIHPKNKQEVGRRLALIAREQLYGTTVDSSGPILASATALDSIVTLTFTHADQGLTANQKPLESFELAGPDGVFHPASAALKNNTVVLHSPAVPTPRHVRYAWSAYTAANLYNGSGLPAPPFAAAIPPPALPQKIKSPTLSQPPSVPK